MAYYCFLEAFDRVKLHRRHISKMNLDSRSCVLSYLRNCSLWTRYFPAKTGLEQDMVEHKPSTTFYFMLFIIDERTFGSLEKSTVEFWTNWLAIRCFDLFY